MLIKEIGTFRGVVQEHAVSLSSGGCPQWCGKLQAVEMYDFETAEWVDYSGNEDCEITAYLTLFTKESKPIFHVESVMKVFEWDGASLAALDGLDLSGAAVQFNVEEHEYEGKVSLQVSGISTFDAPPFVGGGVKKLEAKDLANIDAQFGNALGKLSGGPKVASAPAAAPKTKPKAKSTKIKKEKPVVEAPLAEEFPVEEDTPDVAEDATTAPPAEAPAAPIPPVPAPAAPAPPAAPAAPVAGAEELLYPTKDEAWAGCYGMKAKQVTDEQLAKAFLGAQQKIAAGIDEANITDVQWNGIANQVLAEYGVF